jgi:hypothetical protein
MKRSPLTHVALAAVAALCLTATAWAQATHPATPVLGEGKGQVTLSWDEFVKITGYDPAKRGGQSLTVPWTEVESLLGVELKGKVGMDKATVDLPWNDFKALLEWSIRKKADLEAPPPTDYIVSSSQYEGVLGTDNATFTLTLKINVLRKAGAWKHIPVLPASVAMTDSKLPDGVFLNVAGNAYELLTDKAGPIDATFKFSVQVNKNSGIYTVGFDRVVAGSSVVDLTIDGEQVDAKVAASQSLVTKAAADKKTHVAAAIPSGQPISVTWERAVPKVEAAPTKIYAETRTLAAVAEGILVCQEAIDFNILHTAVKELRLSVPAGVSVLEVTGQSVQDWRLDKSELLVVLRGEVVGPTDLRISYEAPATGSTASGSPPSGEKAEIPVIRAKNVEREKGYVGVIALANVEIDAMPEGATSIDVRQLPTEITAMTKQPILLAFRYVGEKFSIPLAIKKHDEVSVLVTIVDSAVFTTMQLDDGRRMTRVIYAVRNNRNQFLRVVMPENAQIWSASVSGNTVNPATDDKKVLIPLIRSAAGAQELASFPVELVYVETPAKAAPPCGKLHVELPKLDTPTMHVMVNFYAPAEGTYGKPASFMSPARCGFSGTLRLVENFATMAAERAAVVPVDAQKQVQQMQQQFENKMETQAKETGATPIRVRLPIDGKLFKLEKILSLPGDDLFFDVEYSDWKASK